MVKGIQSSQTYEYKIEMLSHVNSGQIMRREFASEFEPGECWGYNKYYRIDELIQEGYLLPENDTVNNYSSYINA